MVITTLRTISAGLCLTLLCACGGSPAETKHPMHAVPVPSEPTVSTSTPTVASLPADPVPPAPASPPVSTTTPTVISTQSGTVTAPVPSVGETGSLNIARSANVTLIGGGFFVGGWGNGMTVDAGTIVNGLFFPRNTQWDQGTVWWDSRDGIERSIVIELDGIYRIDSFVVQADDNDAYLLSYRDASTGAWQTAWKVPNYDVVPSSSNWGMQTRPDPCNDAARYVLPKPIVTDALRFAGDMNDSDRLFSVSEIQAFGVRVPASVPACPSQVPRPAASKAGYGTAVIDGVMAADEWKTAARIDFPANLPSNDGGGTTPASLYIMNDGSNLYFAIQVARTSFGGATNPMFLFDNNDDGCPWEGDDGFGMYVGIYSPPTLSDIYRYSCPGTPEGSVGCSAMDTESSRGILPAGKIEGQTAATNDGTFTIIEMSHPLNSGDALHDIALRPGDSAGFHLSLRLFSLTPACNFGAACYADTELPAGGSYNSYGRIMTAAGTSH
jgi:hypothetical protein